MSQVKEKTTPRSDTTHTTYDGCIVVDAGRLFNKPSVRDLLRTVREKTLHVKSTAKPGR